MPTHLTGGCLCKAVRYEVQGDPNFTIKCFCRDCQHLSGGGHLPQLAFTRDIVTLSGSIKIHQRKSESGNDLEIAFCKDCGSPIYKSTSFMPDAIFLHAGSFDDPSKFEFEKNVYEESKQPWDAS